jgi:hypothetical protein
MAGFREFVTGEVLTAANVDDFLAKQAVMKFADAAARDAALGTAVADGNALREGMVAYLDDEDLPSFYNGTTWTTEFGGGGLVAVKHVLKTNTFTASIAAQGSADVTGLSISHSLADASNKVILMSQISADAAVAFAADGTLISVGDSASGRTRASTIGTGNSSHFAPGLPLTIVYSPSSTSSVTYTVRLVNQSSGTTTRYVNRSSGWDNNEFSVASSSSLVLMEVKV